MAGSGPWDNAGWSPASTVNNPMFWNTQSMTNLIVTRLPHALDLALPDYATAGAAGLDLRAAVALDAPVTLAPGERGLVPTGLVMAVPDGMEAQVRPRSGLALRYGITCLNTPGTIDSDYRGEVQVLLINLGDTPFSIVRNTRIAQLIIAPVIRVTLQEADELPPPTERGSGGFGSTGIG